MNLSMKVENMCVDFEPHEYVFLRQEKKNVGYDRNPTYLYEDVYYCEKCLKYARKKLKETRPNPESFSVEDTVKVYE